MKVKEKTQLYLASWAPLLFVLLLLFTSGCVSGWDPIHGSDAYREREERRTEIREERQRLFREGEFSTGMTKGDVIEMMRGAPDGTRSSAGDGWTRETWYYYKDPDNRYIRGRFYFYFEDGLLSSVSST